MIHVLALEAPDGSRATFSSPVPWAPEHPPTPTVNGRTRSEGYVVVDRRSVRFDEPPRMGDEVGFFVEET